jgi:hypothetical protein
MQSHIKRREITADQDSERLRQALKELLEYLDYKRLTCAESDNCPICRAEKIYEATCETN